jgi:predicted CopG family antitoxin
MSKLIRVKDHTYDELVKRAKWSETLDELIMKLLGQHEKEVSQ